MPAIHVSSAATKDVDARHKSLRLGPPEGGTRVPGERRFCLADDCFECRRLADREIGQHLAVNRDAGFGEAGDEPAVVEAERADRGVEALDPQSAKAALAPLAVAISVLICLLDRLLSDPNRVLAPAIIALGGFEHFLVLGMGGDAAFDASHE